MEQSQQQGNSKQKMGFNATWSMVVGGMIGGGIFSVLGVVIATAGAYAWLSFLLAGVIALLTAHSYVSLAHKFGEGGGAFLYLRRMHLGNLAGSLSWVLIIGYVLTIAVYAFTFGHYIGEVFNLQPAITAACSAAVVVVLTGVNLRGVGEASTLEIVAVWIKLLILGALAFIGFLRFDAASLSYADANPGGLIGALLGAASIFMAYEGFQLLTYDYTEIRNPRRNLSWGTYIGVLTVISTYIIITLSVTTLVDTAKLVQQKEVALALAGEAAAGRTGTLAVSIAAALSTATAINATLFATARLCRKVAADGELPGFLAHRNQRGIPDYAVIILGGLGLLLSITGGLTALVEVASLAFLATFAIVNLIAARELHRNRWVGIVGFSLAVAAAIVLSIKVAVASWWVLAVFAALVLVAVVGRPLMLKHGRADNRNQS